MDTIRDRAKEKFPMVLLTLLSIVQALALEFFWDHIRHRPELLEFSMLSVLGWLQAAATLNIIILIWLMYAGMLMRFLWTPTVTDSIWPFFIGLVQLLMIEIMGARHLALWIFIVAFTYGLTDFINHRAMRRARQDPANREFFDLYAPATLRDFLPQIALIIALVCAGSLVWFSEHQTWFALAIFGFILAGLGYETYKAIRYWDVSMGKGRKKR